MDTPRETYTYLKQINVLSLSILYHIKSIPVKSLRYHLMGIRLLPMMSMTNSTLRKSVVVMAAYVICP